MSDSNRLGLVMLFIVGSFIALVVFSIFILGNSPESIVLLAISAVIGFAFTMFRVKGFMKKIAWYFVLLIPFLVVGYYAIIVLNSASTGLTLLVGYYIGFYGGAQIRRMKRSKTAA